MSRFPATDWIVLSTLRQESDPERAREALETICRLYWYPLYTFARRRGYVQEDAADVTQDFFLHMIERGTMLKASRDKGLFRSFLLASFRNFLSNVETRACAQKRTPGTRILSLDSDSAERVYRAACEDQLTPEQQYERAWAISVAERAWKQLRAKHQTEERAARFQMLCRFVLEGAPRQSYAAIASELNMSAAALKVAVFRLRREFAAALRAELEPMFVTAGELEAEMASVVEHLVRSRSLLRPQSLDENVG